MLALPSRLALTHWLQSLGYLSFGKHFFGEGPPLQPHTSDSQSLSCSHRDQFGRPQAATASATHTAVPAQAQ